MAELVVEDGELVLHLSGVEKAEGAHLDLHVPLSAVRSIDEWIVGAPNPEMVIASLNLGT